MKEKDQPKENVKDTTADPATEVKDTTVDPTTETKDLEESKEQPKPKSKRGVVDDCEWLAVRREAELDSKRIDVLKVKTEVRINHEESTDEFYKIDTKTGISGFCSKKYITVQ